MNRNYECMILLDNREVKKGWDQAKQAVNGLLIKHGAKIVSSKLWAERKLAYPIGRQTRGTYLLVYLEAPTSAVAPIRRELELTEWVMRELVHAIEEVPATAHDPEAAFDVSAIRDEELPAAPAPAAAAPEPAAGGEAAGAGETQPEAAVTAETKES
jgi:small subunit ribosomal protein S6